MKKSFSIIFTTFLITILTSNISLAQKVDGKTMSLFVLNFAKYTQWPNNNMNEIKMAVVGNSNVFVELTKISNTKNVNGKKIVVTKLTDNQIEETKNFQVVILSESSSSLLKKCTDLLQKNPTLLITEKEYLTKKGASISMFLDEEDDFKTKFTINENKILESGLKVSSELLLLRSK